MKETGRGLESGVCCIVAKQSLFCVVAGQQLGKPAPKERPPGPLRVTHSRRSCKPPGLTAL